MRAVVKTAPGPGNVSYADRPDPQAGPGNVVLDVIAAGICGTDLHIEAGEYTCRPPIAMGHEVVGRVAAIGDGVDPALVGARVTSETFFSTCGRCRYCLAGRTSVCRERRSIGTHVDGAFAPKVHVRAAGLHAVPTAMSDRAAAICEPLACVCNSLQDPEAVAAGDEVLVLGPGAIGLVAAQVARAAGGRIHVRGTPADAARLEVARTLGFETSTTASTYDGQAPDVVVECSGSEPGMRAALETVRPRGLIVQMGLRGADVTVPYDLICFNELRVSAGFASTPGAWARAMRLLELGAVDLEPIVSEEVELPDFQRGFDVSRAGAVKVVLVP